MYMAVGDHGVTGFFRRGAPAFGLPAGRRHSVSQRAGSHEHEVDRRHGDEALPYAHFVLVAKMPHQRGGQRCTDHGPAAEAHDRHAGGHAAFVREPLDQGRHRRNVAQAQADTADHAGAQPHQPQLVGFYANGRDQHAAAPAQGRNQAGLAWAGVLQPTAQHRRRAAKEDEEQGVDPAQHRDRPVAFGAEQAGNEAHVWRTGDGRGDAEGLRQRQPEHRKTVGHADAQVDGQGGWRDQPAVEARAGDDALLRQEAWRTGQGPRRDGTGHGSDPSYRVGARKAAQD
ncbi:hypothetical protein D3C80_1184580 [compost metagenome]